MCMANCSCAQCSEEHGGTPALQILPLSEGSKHSEYQDSAQPTFSMVMHLFQRNTCINQQRPGVMNSFLTLMRKSVFSPPGDAGVDTFLPALLKNNYKFLSYLLLRVCWVFSVSMMLFVYNRGCSKNLLTKTSSWMLIQHNYTY